MGERAEHIPIFERGDIRSLPVGYLVLTDKARETLRQSKGGALDYVLSFVVVNGEPIAVEMRWLPTPDGTAYVQLPVAREHQP